MRKRCAGILCSVALHNKASRYARTHVRVSEACLCTRRTNCATVSTHSERASNTRVELTALHANSRILPSITHLIIRIREDARLRTIIMHSKMIHHSRINRRTTIRPSIQIILISHSTPVNLIENATLRTRISNDIQVVEERRHNTRR